MISYKQGNLIEAENYFRKSIQISPRDGSQTELVSLYIQKGRNEEAKRNSLQAIGIHSYGANAHVELGGVCVIIAAGYSEVILTVMTPILLGLVVFAFPLPELIGINCLDWKPN